MWVQPEQKGSSWELKFHLDLTQLEVKVLPKTTPHSFSALKNIYSSRNTAIYFSSSGKSLQRHCSIPLQYISFINTRVSSSLYHCSVLVLKCHCTVTLYGSSHSGCFCSSALWQQKLWIKCFCFMYICMPKKPYPPMQMVLTETEVQVTLWLLYNTIWYIHTWNYVVQEIRFKAAAGHQISPLELMAACKYTWMQLLNWKGDYFLHISPFKNKKKTFTILYDNWWVFYGVHSCFL